MKASEFIKEIFQEMIEKEKQDEEKGKLKASEHNSIIYIIREFKDIKEIREYVKNNFDYILSQINPKDISELMRVVNNEEDEPIQEHKKYSDKEKKADMKGSMEEIVSELSGLSEPELKEEKIDSFINKILKELLKNEGVEISDIKKLGEGGYSRAYKIGNKVIKMGNVDRGTNQIPYHRRIIQPIIRMPIPKINETEKTLLFIEIMEEADIENITEEEVYQVYKELRRDELIWLDPGKANLGRLKRDNKIYFDGIEEVDPNSVGFIGDIPEEKDVLKAGEVVIIDTDHIYRQEEVKASDSAYGYKYEIRYRIENFFKDLEKLRFNVSEIGKATLTGEKAINGVQSQNANAHINQDLSSLKRGIEEVRLND